MTNKAKFNYLIVLTMLVIFVISNNSIYAQQRDTISNSINETETIDKKKNDTKERSEENDNDKNNSTNISEKTVRNISIAFFIIMLILIILFFNHLRIKNQYVGFQSIKYIGLILMFPGICILALVGGSSLISDSTLAALLGTIAGYVLSRERDDDFTDKNEQKLTKENKALKEKENDMLAEITELKDKLSKIKPNE